MILAQALPMPDNGNITGWMLWIMATALAAVFVFYTKSQADRIAAAEKREERATGLVEKMTTSVDRAADAVEKQGDTVADIAKEIVGIADVQNRMATAVADLANRQDDLVALVEAGADDSPAPPSRRRTNSRPPTRS